MKKFFKENAIVFVLLLAVLGLGGVEAVNNATVFTGAVVSKNYVKNANCDYSAHDLTASTGTPAPTSVASGGTACRWNPGSNSATIDILIANVSTDDLGKQCVAHVDAEAYGADGVYTMSLLYDGSQVGATVNATKSDGVFISGDITYPCGTTSSTARKIRITAPASGSVPTLVFRSASFAPLPTINLGLAMPSANLIASGTQAGASGCTYSESTSSGITNFVDLGTGSGCAAWTATGIASFSSANSHQITLTNMPPGDYRAEIAGSAANLASGDCSFRLSDGTNTTYSQNVGAGSSSLGAPTLSFSFSVAQQQTVTYKIQASDTQASGCALRNTTSNNSGMTWSIYYFPNKAQQTWSMTCPFDGSCVNHFTSYVIQNGSTATAGQFNVPAWISCARSGTGAGSCTLQASLFTQAPNCQLTANYVGQYPSINGAVTTTTGFSYEIMNGNGSAGDYPFTVTCDRQGSDVRPVYNAPIFIGSVTTQIPNAVEKRWKFNYFNTAVGTVCSTSPCSTSPTLSNATLTYSGGVYNFQPNAGICSVPVACTVLGSNAVNAIMPLADGSAPTTTSYKFAFVIYGSGTNAVTFGTADCSCY